MAVCTHRERVREGGSERLCVQAQPVVQVAHICVQGRQLLGDGRCDLRACQLPFQAHIHSMTLVPSISGLLLATYKALARLHASVIKERNCKYAAPLLPWGARGPLTLGRGKGMRSGKSMHTVREEHARQLKGSSEARLGVAVSHVRHVVRAVQVLVAVRVVQVAALAAHEVQRAVVVQRHIGANDRAPLGQDLVVGQVGLLLQQVPSQASQRPRCHKKPMYPSACTCMRNSCASSAAAMQALHKLRTSHGGYSLEEALHNEMCGAWAREGLVQNLEKHAARAPRSKCCHCGVHLHLPFSCRWKEPPSRAPCHSWAELWLPGLQHHLEHMPKYGILTDVVRNLQTFARLASSWTFDNHG